MPRDPGGIYFLPAGNPVIPGTVIESDWANPTMSDIGGEVSDSLSRSGKGGMLAALRGLDGSAAQPTFSFTNEPSTGRFRAGPGQVVEAVAGVPVVRYLASGLEQWDSDILGWVPLTPRDALGTPFNPGPSNLVSTNVQDAIEEVNDKSGGQITADAVLYDDTLVYFPAITVQLAIDRLGNDVAGLANDILDNADAINIIGGDLLLLENRVGLNETNIGNNTTNIGLHNTRITENESDISTNQGDISTIKLEQQTQDSRLTQNESNILFNYNTTQTNAGNISTNVNNINSNASRILQNENELDIIGQEWFNNVGVLKVINGGTGVSTSTGTGSTVRSANPTLQGVQLNGSNNTVTQNISNSSTLLATTAFAHAVANAVGDSVLDSVNIDAFEVLANGNGWFMYWRQKNTQIIWLIQWNYKDIGGSSSGTVTLPLAYADSNYTVGTTLTVPSTGHPNGSPYAMIVKAKNSNNWTYATNYSFSWLTIGKF